MTARARAALARWETRWGRRRTSARLADAAAGGCDLAVVTTQPGSKSHQNAQRQGFDVLYTRAVFVKAL